MPGSSERPRIPARERIACRDDFCDLSVALRFPGQVLMSNMQGAGFVAGAEWVFREGSEGLLETEMFSLSLNGWRDAEREREKEREITNCCQHDESFAYSFAFLIA